MAAAHGTQPRFWKMREQDQGQPGLSRQNKGRLLRFTRSLLLILAAGLLAMAGWSHIVMHRSLPAELAERILSATHDETSYEEEQARLSAQAADVETEYTIPDAVSFDEEFAQQTFQGMTTYYLNSSNHSNISILYLHGGAYVHEFSVSQWRLLNKVANETDAEIIAPDYPLAPHHTYEEAYEQLYSWYVPWQYGNDSRILIIMGDSAGGGLALGFTQYLREKDAALPDGLILLSPWTDLTLSNAEIADYDDVDPVLDAGALLADAQSWAGDTALTDYRLSPIYGDLAGLPDVHIVTGTRELLYPDCVTLYEQLTAAGNQAQLLTREGMNHDYLLLPIPEAGTGIRRICEIITDYTS